MEGFVIISKEKGNNALRTSVRSESAVKAWNTPKYPFTQSLSKSFTSLQGDRAGFLSLALAPLSREGDAQVRKGTLRWCSPCGKGMLAWCNRHQQQPISTCQEPSAHKSHPSSTPHSNSSKHPEAKKAGNWEAQNSNCMNATSLFWRLQGSPGSFIQQPLQKFLPNLSQFCPATRTVLPLMLTSSKQLIKTQISILLIKQQVSEIIAIISMYDFSCRMERKKIALLWCLANKLISGEPSNRGRLSLKQSLMACEQIKHPALQKNNGRALETPQNLSKGMWGRSVGLSESTSSRGIPGQGKRAQKGTL